MLSDVQKPEGGSIKHDVSVPVAAVPAFIAEASAAVEAMVPGCRPVPFGHLGDGNIHFNVSQPPGADAERFLARWDEMNARVHAIVAKYHGSISAEHGIGVLKRDLLPAVKDKVALELMRALKRTRTVFSIPARCCEGALTSHLTIAPIADDEVAAVIALWRRCDLTRPWNDPAADVALAQRGPNSTILAGRRDGALVATVMVGHDGHRGWFYYLGVDPAARGKGYGRAMTKAAEAWLAGRGIAKAQLMVRSDNAAVRAFYEALGYGEQERLIFAKWLDGRDPTP